MMGRPKQYIWCAGEKQATEEQVKRAIDLGIDYRTFHRRVYEWDWTVESATTIPKGKKGRPKKHLIEKRRKNER